MSTNNNLSSHTAQEYDSQVRKTIPWYDAFSDITFELIKVVCPSPELWLDTGCGTGTLILKAADIFSSAKFVCCDPSEPMITEAKNKLSHIPPERIEILKPATTQNINWKEDSSDIVTAFMCHHYLSVEERIKASYKCFNLLKDGGVYITFENISPATDYGIKNGLAMWGTYQLSQGKPEEEINKHLSRFGVELKPITIQKHIEILKNCGFKTVELFWYTYMQAGFYAIK
jgi:tRNA (cmo5U34)-methyltransferase